MPTVEISLTEDQFSILQNLEMFSEGSLEQKATSLFGRYLQTEQARQAVYDDWLEKEIALGKAEIQTGNITHHEQVLKEIQDEFGFSL